MLPLSQTPTLIKIKFYEDNLRKLLSSNNIFECELCDKLFERTEDDIREKRWTCPSCTTYHCLECFAELERNDCYCEDCNNALSK